MTEPRMMSDDEITKMQMRDEMFRLMREYNTNKSTWDDETKAAARAEIDRIEAALEEMP